MAARRSKQKKINAVYARGKVHSPVRGTGRKKAVFASSPPVKRGSAVCGRVRISPVHQAATVTPPFQIINSWFFTTPRQYHLCACRGARTCPVQWLDKSPLAQLSRPGRRAVINPYLGLVGDPGQSTGNGHHVDERDPSMAGIPAPVLVTVGVEFCRVG